jgi:uncharacterized protein YkwD
MEWTRRIALLAVAAWMLVVPTGTSAAEWDHLLAPESTCPGQTNLSVLLGAQEEVMACMHDYARLQSGLGDLEVVKRLRTSSHGKARDIKRCKDFSHTACGRNTFHWFVRTGFFRGSYRAGENLAYGFGALGSVRSMMSAWLESDPHRTILLNPAFDRIGVSAVRGRLNRGKAVIWVAHIGSRR